MVIKPSTKSLLAGAWLLIIFMVILGFSSMVQAVPGGSGANWAALPPYNTLWPLWSPALSPINPATGLPTPIVSNLAPSTVLPVQPGLTWDPAKLYPWLLYNTPLGMAYYDPLFGINLWPPSYLTLGPISLPPNYANLPPTSTIWLNTYVPIANALYLKSLPKFALPPAPTTAPSFIPPVPPSPPVPVIPTTALTVPAPPVPPVPTTTLPPVPPTAPTLPATTVPLLTPSAII
ncbi:MAG: hypothetical protein K6U11_08025 [bacterium]|nr:hypothetical protein [bacterium]